MITKKIINKTKLNNTLYKRFLTLANKLPSNGRVSYDSENMIFLKQDVDVLSEYILNSGVCFKSAFVLHQTHKPLIYWHGLKYCYFR